MMMFKAFWAAAASLDAAAEKRDENQIRLSRPGDLERLWKQGGLEKVQEQAIEITMRFSSFADYWDPFLLGQGPVGAYVRTLKGDQLAALREALKKRLNLSSKTSAFQLPARVWAVRGTVPDRR